MAFMIRLENGSFKNYTPIYPGDMTHPTQPASSAIGGGKMFMHDSLYDGVQDGMQYAKEIVEANTNFTPDAVILVYDEGVVSEGYVYYIFTPSETPDRGDCDILSSDVFGGDFFNERAYMLTENGHRLCIFKKTFGGNPEAQYYDILRLTGNHLTLRITDSDILLNFEKTK